MELIDPILMFLTQNSLKLALVAFFLSLTYWIVTHPKKAKIFATNVLDFKTWSVRNLSNIKKKFGRRIDAWIDQRKINKIIRNVNQQTHFNLPIACYHYCSSGNGSYGFQRDGIVDVFVPDSGNANRNFLKATLIFFEVAILPNLRHLDENVVKAMHLTILMRVLEKKDSKGLCTIFWSSFLPGQLTTEVQGYLNKFLLMQSKGTLTGVTLSELQHIDNRPYYQAKLAGETDILKVEMSDFIDFIEAISNRNYGDLTPLEFKRKYISVSVLLVGSPTTKFFGTAPYEKRINSELSKGIRRIYAVAVGKSNTLLVKYLSTIDVEDAVVVRDLKVFRPAAFSYNPTIVSLLVRAQF